MKNFAAFLVAACLAHSCFAFTAQTCLATPSTRCSDVSTLRIEVAAGKCSGTTKASCATWALAEIAFEKAFMEWWRGGDKVCDGDAVKGAARAVAFNIAQIWTSAAEDVECSAGQGFACDWSFADGETFGQSVAEVIAKAAADASLALVEDKDEAGADVADSFCFADVRAIAGGMLQAESLAAADACAASGEAVLVYRDSFASAIEKVVEDTFGSATSIVCTTEGGADVTAASECVGTSAVVGGALIGGPGDFCAGTPLVPSCTGSVQERCCADESADRCKISASVCESCSSPYMRFKKGGLTLFRSSDGDVCLCS